MPVDPTADSRRSIPFQRHSVSRWRSGRLRRTDTTLAPSLKRRLSRFRRRSVDAARTYLATRRALHPERTLSALIRRPEAARIAVLCAALSCLALVVTAPGVTSGSQSRLNAADARSPEPTRDSADRSSRSYDRTTGQGATPPAPGAAPSIDPAAQAAAQAQAQAAAQAAQAAQAAAAQAAAEARRRAANPTPVAGLSQAQMNNARRIVAEGRALGLPKEAYVLAVACAMQESNLLNLASDVLPESYDFPHEGSGSDHDSVGLFQQRPSSGWGSVGDLMTPAYAAKAFYDVLVTIPGWQSMDLTYAIQAVQVSAYPDAYAPHEWAARAVVDALS